MEKIRDGKRIKENGNKPKKKLEQAIINPRKEDDQRHDLVRPGHNLLAYLTCIKEEEERENERKRKTE